MIDLERLEKDIMDFLGELRFEDRFSYRIIIKESVKYDFTEEQKKDFKSFSIHQTNRTPFISPFVDDDITVVNNKVRPITDIIKFNLIDYKV